jgi:hypothetical protein
MIAAFVSGTMNRYIAGGMKPETAARSTREELTAIYKGNHYYRDGVGGMRNTAPPEAMEIEKAMAKCDEAITKILRYCAESANKGPPLNTHGKAPNLPWVQTGSAYKSGFEKMAEYAGMPA